MVFKYAASTQVQQIDYTYDAFDRLVRKATDKTSPFTSTDAVLEYYGYDGQDLLFDISDSDGPNIGQSPAIKRRYLHGPAIDQVLAQETVGGETLWMLTDHQGSVRDLVRNDGTVAAHYQYDSFGKPLDGLENITAFGMNGQRRDTATGFIYAIGRWYDPVAGRWLSEDLSLGPDSNPYRYVHNGAPNFVDSNGRQEHGSWTDGSGSLDSMIIDAVVGGPYYGESAFANGVPIDWEEGLRNLPKDSRGLPIYPPKRLILLDDQIGTFELMLDGMLTVTGAKLAHGVCKVVGKAAAYADEAAELIRATATITKSTRVVKQTVTLAHEAADDAVNMVVVRRVARGEKIADILDEGKRLTFTTDKEHALVKLADGTRAIVRGGDKTITWAEGEVRRLFGHTHPYSVPALGPSRCDVDALKALQQRSSYLLEHGELIRFGTGQ